MSVLLMSFFLLVIVLIISFGLNKQKVLRPGKFSKYGNGTKAKWILGIYVLILLVSVIVLYLIPNKGFLNQNEDYQSKITQAQTALLDIYTAAKEHRLD